MSWPKWNSIDDWPVKKPEQIRLVLVHIRGWPRGYCQTAIPLPQVGEWDHLTDKEKGKVSHWMDLPPYPGDIKEPNHEG